MNVNLMLVLMLRAWELIFCKLQIIGIKPSSNFCKWKTNFRVFVCFYSYLYVKELSTEWQIVLILYYHT